LTASPDKIENDYELEQVIRLTVLEVLCAKRRADPYSPSVMLSELEGLTGRAREHLEFTVWYLAKKNFVQKNDRSELTITVDGVDYLEAHHLNLRRRRLPEGATAA
jgi:hypothetical protein